MNKMSKEALQAYYAEADSWSRDQQQSLRSSRRTAWIVASVAAGIAALEAFALMLLTPLKTVEPYTLLVDRNTGYVQALSPLDAQTISPDRALTQSFLVQYVIARESFDIDTLQANYRKVALWSRDGARAAYLNNMQASSPESPLVRYPRSTILEARVKSVSSLATDTALVRFDVVRRDAGGRVQPPQPFVAVVKYGFSGEPMTADDRFLNPLGFGVTSYRRDMEALPAAEDSSMAPVAVQAAPIPPPAAAAPNAVAPGGQPPSTQTRVARPGQ